MDRPGHHGVGPHSLLFQLYRVRPRVVQYGGAAGRAPVPVLPGGGLHPHPQPEAVLRKGLRPLHRHVSPILLHGLCPRAGAARRVLPRQRHDDHLCDSHGDVPRHRLAGPAAYCPGPGGASSPPGLALPGLRPLPGRPRPGHPRGPGGLLRSPRLGHHRGQQLAGAGHGAGALPVPPEPEGAGTGLRRVLFSLRGGVYGPHGLPDARFRLSYSSSWPLPTCWCGPTGSTPPTA